MEDFSCHICLSRTVVSVAESVPGGIGGGILQEIVVWDPNGWWVNSKWLSDMGVSKNRGTPKSCILIGVSLINHPFWGTPIFGSTHIKQHNKLSG